MTYPTITELEQVLQHHGDDLYRLALLLAPDHTHASNALVRAIQRLASTPGGTPDERALVDALLAVLPQEPRRRATRLPSWALHPEPRSADARLLAAIARLPRDQRLALGLTVLGLLTSHEPPAAGRDPSSDLQAARRDALLALAAPAGFEQLTGQLMDEEAPEECRKARAALLLDDPALHLDPALRGHLALCSACRAISHAWQQLSLRIEDTLRGVFRDTHLPTELNARIRVTLAPKQTSPIRALLESPWPRRAILPLIIIALIAVLVAPRPAPETASPVETAGTFDSHALVERAAASLYAPRGDGVWHERYAVRWGFADGSYAPLVGEIWRDSGIARKRVQLTHESGGGPYEFALADGVQHLWYGVTSVYGASLYPLALDWSRTRVHLLVDPAKQAQVIDAQFENGAWGLPAAYLRQARDASLQSWGRQNSVDGTPLAVIGFRGESLLALPADTAGGAGADVTILLFIAAGDGRLWEVRELIGPPGGDQVSRTTWRFLGAEQIERRVDIERTFNLAYAWNGTGGFNLLEDQLVEPALPLLDPEKVLSPAQALDRSVIQVAFPSVIPDDTTAAALILGDQAPEATLVYIGADRRLALQTLEDSIANQARFSTEGGAEQVSINGRTALLRPTPARGYEALITPAPVTRNDLLLYVSARGYSRDELIATLGSLEPLSVDLYRAQSQLFAGRQHDQATLDALLGALQSIPTLQPEAVQYTVARTYARQQRDPDTLADPYHRIPYGGRPEELIQEVWARQVAESSLAESIITLSDGAGRVYDSHYSSPVDGWSYKEPENTLTLLPPNGAVPPSKPELALLRMLSCSNTRSEPLAEGGLMLISTESDWQTASCQWPEYIELLRSQQIPRWMTAASEMMQPDQGPYLADVITESLTTRIFLNPEGRPSRVETRAGESLDGVLLESWELVSDEQLAGQSFLAVTPPQALIEVNLRSFRSGNQPFSIGMESHTISDSLRLMNTPLFEPPERDQLAGRYSVAQVQGTYGRFTDLRLFEEAVWRGLAVQYEIILGSPAISERARAPRMMIYQGPADTFGALLRSRAVWQHSEQITLMVAGRGLPAWQVLSTSGTWTLVEIDGTLLAFQLDSPEHYALVEQLQQVNP